MNTTDRSRVVHLAEAQAAIPGPAGEHAVSFLRRGTLSAMLSLGRFAPLPRPTTPHQQDEVYVVMAGRGVFFHDGKRDLFEPGDLLFVAAGTEHRFEDFTEDLAVWVIFYGLQGGELQAWSAVSKRGTTEQAAGKVGSLGRTDVILGVATSTPDEWKKVWLRWKSTRVQGR